MAGRFHKIAANDYEVHSEAGVYHCRFRGKLKLERGNALKLAAVGDYVEFTQGDERQGTIEKVLERRSRLSRPDVLKPSKEQAIAANAHVLFSSQPPKNPHSN